MITKLNTEDKKKQIQMNLDRGTRPSGSSAQENRSIYRFQFHI